MLSNHLMALTAVIGLARAVLPARAAIPTKVNGVDYNKPNAGPPAAWFSGDSSLPVSKVAAAAAKASKVPKDASYVLSEGSSKKATIHSDWAGFSKVSDTTNKLCSGIANAKTRELPMFSLPTWT